MSDPAEATSETTNRLMREYLENRDVPCPACGYNLRNLIGQRCPECGERIVIRVGLAEPKLFAPIAGLIGLAAGSGLNGLLLIYAFILDFIRRDGPAESRFWLILGTGFVILGGAMAIWLRSWRVIRRQRAGRKALLVLAAWMLTLVDLLVFSFTIK